MKTFLTRDTTLFPIPSGYIFFDGFSKLGWKTFYVPIEEKISLTEYDYGGEVDIFFDYKNVLSDPNHVEELKKFKDKNPNCKIFVSCFLPYDHNKQTEPDQRFYSYRGIVDYFFNSTIQHDRAKRDFLSLGFEYLCMPYPSIAPQEYSTDQFQYDVSFIGTIDSGNRFIDVWLPEIQKPIYRSFLSGFNGKPGINYETLLNVSSVTKINMNPHYLDQIQEDVDNIHSRIDFNTRVFNLSAIGSFQLSNHPDFKTVFGDSCPIFDETNFLEVFNHYLSNEEARFNVAKNMQKTTLEKYTSKIFAEKISLGNFKFI